jgi:hypothetical protein
MNRLLAIAALSLMLQIRLKTGFVLLRPFEFLVLAALFVEASRTSGRCFRLPVGLLVLVPYFFWHFISAGTISMGNGAREFLQIGVVATFAFLLAQETRAANINRLQHTLLWGMISIMVGVIVWHVYHGYWVGWKQLPDPRLVFTMVPALLAGIILFSRPEKQFRLWLAWMGLGPVLLLSGERKAVVIYLFLTALMLARGRMVAITATAMGGFAALFVLSTLVDNPYLQKQMHTLVDPTGGGDYKYVIELGRYRPGDTPSGVQRSFAFAISKELIAEHPMFGIGTNEYERIVKQRFAVLPADLRLGIHGEFQRVLTENGILGFALYILIWIVSWVRVRRVLRRALGQHLISDIQKRVLPLLIFVPLALYLASEAPGSRSFVALIVISLLPELVSRSLMNRTQTAVVSSRLTSKLLTRRGISGVKIARSHS